MKKHLNFLFVGVVLLLIFITISAITFQKSSNLIKQGYLELEGHSAENFAVLTAANIHLTDEQVTRLKNYSYDELQISPENLALKKMMSNESFINKVDYAYIMIHLKNDEVKYSVSNDNKNLFNAPIGTKLDIMWLLDVNVSEESIEFDKNLENDNYKRYSYYIEEDKQIFGEAPTYIFNKSEWGDHICGYAPIYSTSGKYIGVIGVELKTGEYISYSDKAVIAMGLLVLVSMILLSCLFFYIYWQYRKVQFKKIYLDSLTRVYNRSYYNNRFIKSMNGWHSGEKFVLMIADVDWFKNVNDTFGHEIGDEVLIELGALFVEVFGMNNVVRFGGEEFVFGFWVSDEEEINKKLEYLYEQIHNSKFTSMAITLTISVGCSFYKTGTVDGWLLSELLRAADCKLYEAKNSGRDKYIIEYYNENEQYKKTK